MRERISLEKKASILLEVEILVNLGNPISQACQKVGITESEYIKWRANSSYLNMDAAIVNYSETKKQTEQVLRIAEQQVRPKVFQQIVVRFLKDNKRISPDFINKVKDLYLEAEEIQRILLDTVFHRKKDHTPIACHKGCDYCCGLKVVATEPELTIIGEYLLDTLPKEKLTQLIDRLGRNSSQMQTCTTRSEKLAIKCSFLEDGACGIYEVRPLACRAWNSADVEICKRYLESTEEEIPVSICHYAPFDVIKQGITQGLYTAGCTPPSQELNAGILRILKG